MSAEYLALLRGVNVGGNNKLPMRDLIEIVAALGCVNVQTFIQSGNVVFDMKASQFEGLGERISDAIHTRFGFRPAAILRTRDEVLRTLDECPFSDTEIQHVVFLSEPAHAGLVKYIQSLDPSPDAFSLQEREIYLRLPNGVSGARLTVTNFYSKLGIHSARNWRTVTKLAELMVG